MVEGCLVGDAVIQMVNGLVYREVGCELSVGDEWR